MFLQLSCYCIWHGNSPFISKTPLSPGFLDSKVFWYISCSFFLYQVYTCTYPYYHELQSRFLADFKSTSHVLVHFIQYELCIPKEEVRKLCLGLEAKRGYMEIRLCQSSASMWDLTGKWGTRLGEDEGGSIQPTSTRQGDPHLWPVPVMPVEVSGFLLVHSHDIVRKLLAA